MNRLPKGLISHWHSSRPGLHASAQELYGAIERKLAALNLPNSEHSRVHYREAGIFSAKREYLQVQRRQYVFDICGAPFGDGFFVSWWLSVPVLPVLLRAMFFVWCALSWTLWAALLWLVQSIALWGALQYLHVPIEAPGKLGAAVVPLLLTVLGSMVVFALSSVIGAWTGLFTYLHLMVVVGLFYEETIESIPFFGLVYRWVISPITYYRLDTAMMFRNAVHAAVLDALDEITANKGLRVAPLTEQERRPVMRGMIAA